MEYIFLVSISFVVGMYAGQSREITLVKEWLRREHMRATAPRPLFPLHIVKRLEEKEHHETV